MERYPIGGRGPVRVEVRRTADALSLCLVVGSTTLLFGGDYGVDLATRHFECRSPAGPHGRRLRGTALRPAT